MLIKFRDLKMNNKKVQDSFNLKVNRFLESKIDYDSLSQEDKHNVLFQVVHKCQMCSPYYKKITPKYNNNPQALLLGRASTKKDILSESIFDETHSSYSILKRMLLILGIDINNIYYTNLCFCSTKKVNELTSIHLNKCSLFKDLEFQTLNLPDIIFILGNDCFNYMYNLGCSVNKILGTFYISEFYGRNRLFIPIPHPVYLIRDDYLRSITEKELTSLSKVINLILEEVNK